MAFMDNTLAFSTSWSTAQAITTTADSTNVVDITGAGVGNAPTMINGFPALNTAIGADWGAGDGEAIPYLYLGVTVAGSTSNTLTIALKAAADNGSYSAGTYYTIYTSAAVTCSGLVKGSTLLVPVPPALINFPTATEGLPRFYKLTYTCSGSLTISVLSGLMLNPPSSYLLGQYNNNFTVV